MTTNLPTRGDASWNGRDQVPDTFNIHKEEADKVNRTYHFSDSLEGFNAKQLKFWSSLPLVWY